MMEVLLSVGSTACNVEDAFYETENEEPLFRDPYKARVEGEMLLKSGTQPEAIVAGSG